MSFLLLGSCPRDRQERLCWTDAWKIFFFHKPPDFFFLLSLHAVISSHSFIFIPFKYFVFAMRKKFCERMRGISREHQYRAQSNCHFSFVQNKLSVREKMLFIYIVEVYLLPICVMRGLEVRHFRMSLIYKHYFGTDVDDCYIVWSGWEFLCDDGNYFCWERIVRGI